MELLSLVPFVRDEGVLGVYDKRRYSLHRKFDLRTFHNKQRRSNLHTSYTRVCLDLIITRFYHKVFQLILLMQNVHFLNTYRVLLHFGWANGQFLHTQIRPLLEEVLLVKVEGWP